MRCEVDTDQLDDAAAAAGRRRRPQPGRASRRRWRSCSCGTTRSGRGGCRRAGGMTRRPRGPDWRPPAPRAGLRGAATRRAAAGAADRRGSDRRGRAGPAGRAPGPDHAARLDLRADARSPRRAATPQEALQDRGQPGGTAATVHARPDPVVPVRAAARHLARRADRLALPDLRRPGRRADEHLPGHQAHQGRRGDRPPGADRLDRGRPPCARWRSRCWWPWRRTWSWPCSRRRRCGARACRWPARSPSALAEAGCGLVFAAIAAVAAQVSGTARGARGMAIAVLAVAFLLRGIGDSAGRHGAGLGDLAVARSAGPSSSGRSPATAGGCSHCRSRRRWRAPRPPSRWPHTAIQGAGLMQPRPGRPAARPAGWRGPLAWPGGCSAAALAGWTAGFLAGGRDRGGGQGHRLAARLQRPRPRARHRARSAARPA